MLQSVYVSLSIEISNTVLQVVRVNVTCNWADSKFHFYSIQALMTCNKFCAEIPY